MALTILLTSIAVIILRILITQVTLAPIESTYTTLQITLILHAHAGLVKRGQEVVKHFKGVVMMERLHHTLRDKGYYQMAQAVRNRQPKDQQFSSLDPEPGDSLPPYEPPAPEDRAPLPGNVRLEPALPVQLRKTHEQQLIHQRELSRLRTQKSRRINKAAPLSKKKQKQNLRASNLSPTDVAAIDVATRARAAVAAACSAAAASLAASSATSPAARGSASGALSSYVHQKANGKDEVD
jgi:hypothetical protein